MKFIVEQEINFFFFLSLGIPKKKENPFWKKNILFFFPAGKKTKERPADSRGGSRNPDGFVFEWMILFFIDVIDFFQI